MPKLHTMGFKKGNYTHKGICACIYIILLANMSSVIGQSHCPVRVEYEPRESKQTRSANSIEEVKFPFFQQWENLSNIRISDNERASAMLSGNKRSTLFKNTNLGFSIPSGAKINGIELIVEGHSMGDGFVAGQLVKLIDNSGDVIGNNQALHALPTEADWPKDTSSTDFTWRYGSSDDTWGVYLSDQFINNPDFGYALQVRNKLNKPVSVFIDHIEMVVYYTPLYEVCSTHACVPFYIDKSEDPLVSYEWYIPEGFELISDSEEDAAINIGVSYADFGTYEICVESFYKQSSLGTCCRKFNYSNCEPSLISGQVFFDKNNDSTNNNDDQGINDILINLYSGQGAFISSTFTNINGAYEFPDLQPGAFYIEVVEDIDSLLFTFPNIGLESQDSDITGAYGVGTTDLIVLDSGDTLNHVDAGLNLALSIGDFVWEDLNGDGMQQDGEPGIEGIEVKVTSSNSIVYSIKTDSEGFYAFTGLPAGDYVLEFIASGDYNPTKANASDNQTDSDNIPDAPVMLSFTEGGVIDSIDAGYFRTSTIGDFVWEDLNSNGIQDDDEPGIADVILNLFNSNIELVQTTSSDSLGRYIFDNIAPGEYFVEIIPETRYSPTLFEEGSDNNSNSDVFKEGDKFVSSFFTLISNTTDLSLDFGFVEKPATIGGFTYLDKNNNGKYESDEPFVPNVDVILFDSNDERIDSTQSDSGGFYSFKDILASSYYLIFELPVDHLFTTANASDDLIDSDVTNLFGIGSTDLFSLEPDEENFSFSAGYQQKPKIGDFVWLDENGDGVQDPVEAGLNDILVELYNDQSELLGSVLTTFNPETLEPGYYQFASLDLGKYFIKVPVEELYDFTIVNDTAIGLNSSITNANGDGTSNTFNLIGNQCQNDIDVGYAYNKGNVQGEIWIDQNEDGIQDVDEKPKSGVFIELFDENGERLFFRNSNENGEYFFNGLDEGKYFIVFTPTDQYGFTNANTGSDISVDSDVTSEITTGSTALFDVFDGVTLQDIDAGLLGWCCRYRRYNMDR